MIAVGGRWPGRRARTPDGGGKVAVPDWQTSHSTAGEVVLAFDRDVTTRTGNVRPGTRSARPHYLVSKDGEVRYLWLPDDEAGKIGVDDYIAGRTQGRMNCGRWYGQTCRRSPSGPDAGPKDRAGRHRRSTGRPPRHAEVFRGGCGWMTTTPMLLERRRRRSRTVTDWRPGLGADRRPVLRRQDARTLSGARRSAYISAAVDVHHHIEGALLSGNLPAGTRRGRHRRATAARSATRRARLIKDVTSILSHEPGPAGRGHRRAPRGLRRDLGRRSAPTAAGGCLGRHVRRRRWR